MGANVRVSKSQDTTYKNPYYVDCRLSRACVARGDAIAKRVTRPLKENNRKE
jgi:hypothetical protein